MFPDRKSNPGPLTYESGALPIALRGPAQNSKTTCTSSYHRKKVNKISNESDERCRRSCGEKISWPDGRMDGRTDGIMHTLTDEVISIVPLCLCRVTINILTVMY